MKWVTAGAVLGVGLGGFADGILLHQIAQWHNMGSAVLPPVTMDAMHRNMAWDGFFHLATWGMTVIGVFMLRRELRHGSAEPSGAAFVGQLVFGWGAFNLVEGVIDHHLLQLHHVRDLPVHIALYDWLFLAIAGLGFLSVGWFLQQTGRRRASLQARD